MVRHEISKLVPEFTPAGTLVHLKDFRQAERPS